MTILPFPSLIIQPLEAVWLDSTARFLYQNWHEVYDTHLPEELSRQRTLEYFTENLQKRLDNCFIALLGKQLVGLVITSSNCIDDIWVSARYRHRHIGKKLINQAKMHLQSGGFDSVQVGCESFNTVTIAFFQALNWRKLGSEPVTLSPGHSCDVLLFGTRL